MKRKPLPPTWFLSALTLMAALHLWAPVCQVIGWPWRLLGAASILIGCILNLWADQVFKKAHTTVKPFERSSALVTTGPFRFSRHPMYVGMTAILLGVWLTLGTLSPAIAVILFAATAAIRFIPVEERMMVEQFGSAYADYARRVRRWL